MLPVGAYTQFFWTLNARSLMNFVSLRNSEFAQLEIRRYAEAVEAFLAEKMPVTHAAFVANDRVAPELEQYVGSYVFLTPHSVSSYSGSVEAGIARRLRPF